MKILFLSHSSPLKEGGAETRTREVARRLHLEGHEVTILCGKTDAHDPANQDWNGVRLIYKKILPDFITRKFPYPHYLGLAASNLLLMFHIRSLLRKEYFDVMREDVSPFPPSFLLSLLRLPVHKRIAVVHMLPATLHDWIKHYGTVFGFGGFLMNRLLRSGKLKYQSIVCASEWTAKELRTSSKLKEHIYFVPNGVNLEDFDHSQKGISSSGQIRLLSIGRLVATKGHRYGIEALSRLKMDYPSLSLQILGDGPLKEELLALCQKLALSDSVEFLPPVPHDQMPAIYSASDFFFMPSIWEGFPVSLLESMASKLPIVATDIQGIKEILDDDSAILASPENPIDLAEKLKWAIQHPNEMALRAEKALQKASHYRWENTAWGELEAMAAKKPQAENPTPSISA